MKHVDNLGFKVSGLGLVSYIGLSGSALMPLLSRGLLAPCSGGALVFKGDTREPLCTLWVFSAILEVALKGIMWGA